jgi:hypothetical protein
MRSSGSLYSPEIHFGEAYKIFVVKPEGKREVVRPIRGWGDNIKLDHKKIGVLV